MKALHRGAHDELHHTSRALFRATHGVAFKTDTGWQTLQHRAKAFRSALERHVTMTEAPMGLLEEVRARTPRLTGQVKSLSSDHHTLRTELGALLFLVSRAESQERWERSNQLARKLLRRVSEHERSVTRLVQDAYAVDIGPSD